MEKQTKKATRRALYSSKSWGRGGKKKGYKPYASRCRRRAGKQLAKDETMRDEERRQVPYPEPQLQVVEVEETPDRLEQLRRIVTEHQACEVEGHLVDAFTASMLVKVCDALNETNRAKFLALPLPRMADVGWKLVN